MNFEPYDVKPKWALLADYFRSQEPDHIADTDGLALVIDTKPEHVGSVVHTLNRRMTNEGFRLTHVRGVGYRIATPAECIAEAAVRRPRWIVRGIRRAKGAAIAATKNPDATPEERRRADEVALAHAEHERIAAKQRASLRVHMPEPPVVRVSGEL